MAGTLPLASAGVARLRASEGAGRARRAAPRRGTMSTAGAAGARWRSGRRYGRWPADEAGSVDPEYADLRREGDEAMYKTLVVGTDGSPTADKAVQAAADLARSLGCGAAHRHGRQRAATRHGRGVGRRPGRQRRRPGPGRGGGPGRGRGGDREVRRGPEAEAHAAQGNPDDVILNTAVDVGADLIVVGSKGMRAPGAISAACRTRWRTAPTAPCWWSRPPRAAPRRAASVGRPAGHRVVGVAPLRPGETWPEHRSCSSS